MIVGKAGLARLVDGRTSMARRREVRLGRVRQARKSLSPQIWVLLGSSWICAVREGASRPAVIGKAWRRHAASRNVSGARGNAGSARVGAAAFVMCRQSPDGSCLARLAWRGTLSRGTPLNDGAGQCKAGREMLGRARFLLGTALRDVGRARMGEAGWERIISARSSQGRVKNVYARQAGLGRAYLRKAAELLGLSCESLSRLGEAGKATLVPPMLACERN